MTYEECVEQIREGSVIEFKEYTLDRHERRHLAMHIEQTVVYKILPQNVTISREVLEEIYGTDLETEDYLQLSCMNCQRYVLSLGINSDGEMDIKVICLNKDYYNTGLQEVIVSNSFTSVDEPNYFLANQNFMM